MLSAMSQWLNKAEHRIWLYRISLAVIPLLVAYGVVAESAAPLWVALVGSVLASSLALTHISPDEEPEG